MSAVTMASTSKPSDDEHGFQPKIEEVTNNGIQSTERTKYRSQVSFDLFRLLGARILPGEDPNYSACERFKFLRELFAECLGTFMIVQLGTGAVMSAIFTNSLVGLFQIAAVWVIAVTLAICSTASISGAHLNPAISIAFALFRRSKTFGWSKVIPYILAQTLGAMLGSWTNLLMFGSSIREFETANGIIRSSANSIASAKAFGEI